MLHIHLCCREPRWALGPLLAAASEGLELLGVEGPHCLRQRWASVTKEHREQCVVVCSSDLLLTSLECNRMTDVKSNQEHLESLTCVEAPWIETTNNQQRKQREQMKQRFRGKSCNNVSRVRLLGLSQSTNQSMGL